MKTILKVTGITIALTAIGVAMRARVKKNERISKGTINGSKIHFINSSY